MSKEITIDKLTIGNKLTSREVDSTDIFVDGISVKEALKKLPPTWVKSVNNTLPDTNGNIEIVVLEKTASFEVLAFDKDIPVGTIDNQDSLGTLLGFTNSTGTDMEYKVVVSNNAKKTGFTLKTAVPKSMSDVIIDFGDGSDLVYVKTTDSDEITYTGSNQDYQIVANHQYKDNGKYKITIYGKNFFTLRYINHLTAIFNDDLGVFGTNIYNIANLCKGCLTLLKVNAHEYINFNMLQNLTEAFSGCKNLQVVSGLADMLQHDIFNCNSMFKNCTNLTTCDIRLPSRCFGGAGFSQMYSGCMNLEVDVSTLLPLDGFASIIQTGNPGPFPGTSLRETTAVQSKITLNKSNLAKMKRILWNSNTKFYSQYSDNNEQSAINFFNSMWCDDVRKYIPIQFGGSLLGDGDTVQLNAMVAENVPGGVANYFYHEGTRYVMSTMLLAGKITLMSDSLKSVTKTETRTYRIVGGSTIDCSQCNYLTISEDIINTIKSSTDSTMFNVKFTYDTSISKWVAEII